MPMLPLLSTVKIFDEVATVRSAFEAWVVVPTERPFNIETPDEANWKELVPDKRVKLES
jgi:hypothetical protein